MKKQKITAALLGLSLVLTGCGYTPIEGRPNGWDTIRIQKDGSVSYSYSGAFDESYYELDGLKATAQEAVKEYNADYGKQVVSLADAELETHSDGTTAWLQLDFTEARAVEGMTDVYLFYGTLAESAVSDRSPNNVTLTHLGQGETATGLELVSAGVDGHVIITNFKGAVVSPYEPEYISEGVQAVGSEAGSYIDTTNVTADIAVIILKK